MTPHSLTGLFSRLGLGFHFHFNFNIQPLFTSSSSPKQNPNSGDFEVFRPAVVTCAALCVWLRLVRSPSLCACGYVFFLRRGCVFILRRGCVFFLRRGCVLSPFAVCFLHSSLCAFKYHEDL
ncbi:T9SS C-terminal target domain-containing protein [Sesbania bispinosa]|nr:T9SS C-terminal target domain-containing protein [Sesbania bispinosa]